MLIIIDVNNNKLRAEKGETILDALNRNGINIPTLCRLRDLSPTGACRICVVEVEGEDMLVTACSEPVREWMKIRTHSPRVIKARKAIVELLLAGHPDNCLYCDRNLSCELQRIASELNIRERRVSSRRINPGIDASSPAISREPAKCILCGRCVRVCEEVVMVNTLDFIGRGRHTHIGTTMDKDFNFSSCIHCGQCVNVCPTGALHEKYNITEVQDYLVKDDMLKVIQYSPLVASAVAEEMGVKYSAAFDKRLNGALIRLGFDRVYTTGFGADIMISELAGQLCEKKDSGSSIPVYSSHCPAWVKYAEQFMPGSLAELSGLKSSRQITGAVIKAMVPERESLKAEQLYSVAVTTCTAAKYESRRDDMTRRGISDIETVLTVRELVQMIRLYGIDIEKLEGRHADEPFNHGSSASALTEMSGGLTEAVIRHIAHQHGARLPATELRKLKPGAAFRELKISIADRDYKFAVVDGMAGLAKLKSAMSSGGSSGNYDMVEVMACRSGCVSGGGMNSRGTDDELKERIRTLGRTEGQSAIHLPADSPAWRNFYEKWLPGSSELSGKKAFRNEYREKKVLL